MSKPKKRKQTAVSWKIGGTCEKVLKLKCRNCNREFEETFMQECGRGNILHPQGRTVTCPHCHNNVPWMMYEFYRPLCMECLR